MFAFPKEKIYINRKRGIQFWKYIRARIVSGPDYDYFP